MSDDHTGILDVSRLRIGHFIYIDLNWISHPFPLNSFRIQSQEQIETIRSLGITRIRYSPERSDPERLALETAALACEPARYEVSAPPPESPTSSGGDPASAHDAERRRREALAEQRASLRACEREFSIASRGFLGVVDSLRTKPDAALKAAAKVVGGLSDHLLGAGEICIRLLSEKVGELASHEINVAVLSLLLGRSCGLDQSALHELGLGALLHDIGKIELPDRLRYPNEQRSPAEQKAYEKHVGYGAALGRSMGLPPAALAIIAQHHERADGSGYPKHLKNSKLSAASRIVSLVNYYDNLCNPPDRTLGMTPHEALSQVFTFKNERFDETTVNTLIRMMGVYPPGSVVQLTDNRYALVASVNAQRPLKPRVIVHDAGIPREEALVVDLAEHSEIGIRRSLRPLQLPRTTYDYLSPRTRICYFFEHATGVLEDGASQ